MIISVILSILAMEGRNSYVVVADSVTGTPLPNASVYDRNGKALGMSDVNGRIQSISHKSFPITIRYIGFRDKKVIEMDSDTVFLQEEYSVLPELVVESKRHKLLHILAYIREYSTLTTYADTIFLFREKMVDYMLAVDAKVKFRGWTNPRVLTAKSYVRFTNANGLDSVSDATPHHFSWSDWMGLPPSMAIPVKLRNVETGCDTIFGKYSPTEIWSKTGDMVSVKINVLADTTSRRWVPKLAGFFRQNVDFETLKLSCFFENVLSERITPMGLEKIVYCIESQGRGRSMFRFNRKDEPFFVSTDAEVYIIDHEYIDEREGRKWEGGNYDEDLIDLLAPATAPELHFDIQKLISRVEGIDKDSLRLQATPDSRMIGRMKSPKSGIVGKALNFLRKRVGI